MVRDVILSMHSFRSLVVALAVPVLAGSALAQTGPAAGLNAAAAPAPLPGNSTSNLQSLPSRSGQGSVLIPSDDLQPSPGYFSVFISTLSARDQSAAGITKMSADEQSLLNSLVAREVSLARAGNVRGFAGTFIGRRTADERAKAGLDRLMPDEQVRLNSLVAMALAAGPVRRESAQYLGKDAVSVLNRLQIHGEVSLTFGSSGGGHNFYGSSLFTTITDPETNLTIGIGLEQYKGDGWFESGDGPDDFADGDFRGRGFGSGGWFRRH